MTSYDSLVKRLSSLQSFRTGLKAPSYLDEDRMANI